MDTALTQAAIFALQAIEYPVSEIFSTDWQATIQQDIFQENTGENPRITTLQFSAKSQMGTVDYALYRSLSDDGGQYAPWRKVGSLLMYDVFDRLVDWHAIVRDMLLQTAPTYPLNVFTRIVQEHLINYDATHERLLISYFEEMYEDYKAGRYEFKAGVGGSRRRYAGILVAGSMRHYFKNFLDPSNKGLSAKDQLFLGDMFSCVVREIDWSVAIEALGKKSYK